MDLSSQPVQIWAFFSTNAVYPYIERLCLISLNLDGIYLISYVLNKNATFMIISIKYFKLFEFVDKSPTIFDH